MKIFKTNSKEIINNCQLYTSAFNPYLMQLKTENQLLEQSFNQLQRTV